MKFDNKNVATSTRNFIKQAKKRNMLTACLWYPQYIYFIHTVSENNNKKKSTCSACLMLGYMKTLNLYEYKPLINIILSDCICILHIQTQTFRFISGLTLHLDIPIKCRTVFHSIHFMRAVDVSDVSGSLLTNKMRH